MKKEMKKETQFCIGLYKSLAPKEKQKIWCFWRCNEDIYLKLHQIKSYCKKNDCDYFMALHYLYFKLDNYYICSYMDNNSPEFTDKYDYFTKTELGELLVKRLDKYNIDFSKDILKIFDVVKENGYYGYDQAVENKFHYFNRINVHRISQNKEDKEMIWELMMDIIKKRRKAPLKWRSNLIPLELLIMPESTFFDKTEDELKFFNEIQEITSLMHVHYLTKREIGVIIKNRRLELDLTQTELSDKLNLKSYNNIIALEKGRRGLSVESLNNICDALDLELKITKRE